MSLLIALTKFDPEIPPDKFKIESKEELKQVLKESYKLNGTKDVDELKEHIYNLIQNGIIYERRQDINRERILNEMFPNLKQFADSLLKLRQFGLEDKLYTGLDLEHLDLSELSNKSIEIVKKEEMYRANELRKKEQEKIKQEQKKIETNQRIKKENLEKLIVEQKKNEIDQTSKSIPDKIERTYNELKVQEVKFSNFAMKLGLNYSVIKTDNTNIYESINQIKDNMQMISEKVQKLSNSSKLDKVSEVLQELNGLTNAETIKFEHTKMLKNAFEKSFDSKVQELIISAKLSKLEKEKSKVESEKISWIGKLFGKGKLKQAKLDNIELKKQLIITEKKEKLIYSLEDSLSDLYTYSHCELGNNLTPEMKLFLSTINTQPQLKQMIDQQSLKEQYVQKVKNKERITQLIPVDENRRTSNRQQANILQIENNEIRKQVQNNRAKTLTRQNGLSNISMNYDNALNKFQSIVNEIKLSTQIKDVKQQQRDITVQFNK